jgi:hypothetical protein
VETEAEGGKRYELAFFGPSYTPLLYNYIANVKCY